MWGYRFPECKINKKEWDWEYVGVAIWFVFGKRDLDLSYMDSNLYLSNRIYGANSFDLGIKKRGP